MARKRGNNEGCICTKKRKEGLSARTVQLIHVVAHAALERALKLGYVPRDVVKSLKAWRVQWKEEG